MLRKHRSATRLQARPRHTLPVAVRRRLKALHDEHFRAKTASDRHNIMSGLRVLHLIGVLRMTGRSGYYAPPSYIVCSHLMILASVYFTYGVLRRARSIHQHRYQVAKLAFFSSYGVCFSVGLGTGRRRVLEYEDGRDYSMEKMSEHLEWILWGWTAALWKGKPSYLVSGSQHRNWTADSSLS